MKPISALAVLLSFCCAACRQNATTAQVIPAFYAWQTDEYGYYVPDQITARLGIQKIYLRLFDVRWDASAHQPVPAGPYRGGWNFPDGVEAIPVVFITNETLQQLDSAGCANLAVRMTRKTTAMLKRLAVTVARDRRETLKWTEGQKFPEDTIEAQADSARQRWLTDIREIQIDCDWTPSTRQKFFYLLEQLKTQNSGRQLSCTIRLHQYKNPEQTGVPPVARGMLMCYNVDDIKDPLTINSIFNLAEARKYLENAPDYPLPLDVALPAFRWGVLFHLDKFVAIVPENVFEEYKERNFKEIAPKRFQATVDFTMNDEYVREGDVLRFESPDPAEVLQTIQLLRKQRLAEPLSVSFFHLTDDINDEKQTAYIQDMLAAFR